MLEEAGELAAQINHFEDSGVKRAKHGGPDRLALAKEVQDVIRCALQVAHYYDLDAELEASVEKSYQQYLENVLTDKCLPLCYSAPMNKEPDNGHDPTAKANNQSQLFNEHRHQLEALFRMAHKRNQQKPIGRFNRNEIYGERIESICRGSAQ